MPLAHLDSVQPVPVYQPTWRRASPTEGALVDEQAPRSTFGLVFCQYVRRCESRIGSPARRRFSPSCTPRPLSVRQRAARSNSAHRSALVRTCLGAPHGTPSEPTATSASEPHPSLQPSSLRHQVLDKTPNATPPGDQWNGHPRVEQATRATPLRLTIKIAIQQRINDRKSCAGCWCGQLPPQRRLWTI